MTLQQAFQIIMAQPSNGLMAYAQNYTKAAMELGGSKEAEVIESGVGIAVVHKPTGKMMIGEELETQILYILSNLSSWKGEQAKEVKAFLKQLK
jgi:hypothetical protein